MKHRIFKKTISIFLAICLLPVVHPIHAVTTEETALLPATEVQPQTVIEPAELKDSSNSAEVLSALVEGSQILTHVNEDVLRENKHVARLTQEESLSNYVFLNSDGSKTVYYLDEEVKFIDTDGTQKEKNLNLSLGRDGYSTTLNDVGLTLPTKPSSGIRLSYSGYDIKLTPEGGSNLVVAQKNGNSVTYADYFGNGMSLVYTPTLSGVKEDILLDQYRGVTDFTFLLETDGLGLYQSNGKYYLAAAENAEMRIDLGEVVAYDSAGHFNLGSMTATTVTANQQYRLTLHANADFLQDAKTVYPVWIDPTLSVSDNTHGINAIEDITLYSGRPDANCNWQYLNCGYYDSTYQIGRTLVRLNGLTSNSTYASMSENNIKSAIFYICEATGTASFPVHLFANTGSSVWTESGATWHNAGYVFGTAYTTASPGADTYAAYNITGLVRAWKRGAENPAAGFILQSGNESMASKSFYSSEYNSSSSRPYVVVTYAETIVMDYTYSTYAETVAYNNGLQDKMNCYGYALQVHLVGEPEGSETIYYRQQPGEFAQDSMTYGDLYDYYADNSSSAQEYLNTLDTLINDDFDSFESIYGWTIQGTTATAAVPQGYRKIALTIYHEVYSPGHVNLGFHFYMRHSDGMWSHKPGGSIITNLSITSKQIITDSNISTVITEGGYDDGVRYYLISKPAVIDYAHTSGQSENCLYAEFDGSKRAGDIIEKSASIDIGFNYALFDYVNDRDYFKFTPTVTARYLLTTGNNTDNIKYILYNSNGYKLAEDLDASKPEIYYNLSAGATYYLCVYTTYQYATNYTVKVNIV